MTVISAEDQVHFLHADKLINLMEQTYRQETEIHKKPI